MTAPTTTLSDSDLETIERFHGHICSMVLLGARMARVAGGRLITWNEDPPRLFAFFRGYGCAVDGVQIMSGCTWGNGNLVLLRGREFSLVLTAEGSPKAVKAVPLPNILSGVRGARGGILDTALGDLILKGPGEDLFTIEEVTGLPELSRFPA